MYRAVVYHALYKNDPDAIRLTSESRNTRQEADALLERLLAQTPHLTGGDIEAHIPGIGWTVATEVEEESISFLMRLKEDETAETEAGYDKLASGWVG